MRLPESLSGLIDLGVIDDVIRPLMSGKEAQVFLVEAAGERRVAKIYKDAQNRSFRQRAQYAEGRRVKNSRRQRAMDKRTRYGRQEEELAWKSAEVDAIRLLSDHGVRVPTPYEFVDGVLVMELIAGHDGEPAPRLVDVHLGRDEALDVFQFVVRQVCRMLCAGLVHGDLSDFNILMSSDGPVLIDFPQSVDAAANNNARKLLIRDVTNLQGYLGRWAPELRRTRYGHEMWDLYDRGLLQPESKLTGKFKRKGGTTNTDAIIREIREAEREEQARRERMGLDPVAPVSKYAAKKQKARQEMAAVAPPPKTLTPGSGAGGSPKKKKRRRKKKKPTSSESGAAAIPNLDALLIIGD